MNELKNAASPYLLQHADNPVHWRLWTNAALAEAKRLDRPVLLSIGYAACHWCHVMAHESFEDPATAAVMNDLFVTIKVDREERPDVDHIYMAAVRAFDAAGGWPLTLFLTPDGAPFWGGTYFPKTARYGKPGFVDVLRTVAHTYRADPSRVAHNAKVVLDQLARTDAGGAGAVPTLRDLDAIAETVARHMDPDNGGLAGAPKFPNPAVLEFLWRAAGRTRHPGYYDGVLLTLEHMSQGGIYDHLGGGFARYSTDARWLVPHFEKMLYDNAQLLPLLALAAEKTGETLYAQRAAEIVAWLTREMTGPDGAFHASLDADSEGVEGKFYVWTAPEIEAVLGPAEAALFNRIYDVTPAGNWHDAAHGGGVCVLNRLVPAETSLADEARLAAARQKLLDHRAARPRPALDDKVLTDWNGLMIAGLVNAGTLMERPDWIARAAQAYRAIIAAMAYADAQGMMRLAHAKRGAAVVKPGLALDHAAMLRAALALHEARGLIEGSARDYLQDARHFATALDTRHRDPATGRLRMSAADADDIILRLAPSEDDATPNAHGVALDGLIRLAALSGEPHWLDRADTLFSALAGAVQANPIAHLGIVNALETRLRGMSVITAGPLRDPFTRTALAAPFLLRSVIDLDDPSALPPDHPAHAQLTMAGEGAAFVCVEGACSLPIRDMDVLTERLS